MGMALPDPDPDYLYWSFRWKSADVLDGKEKSAELNCFQFFAQRELNIFANLVEKAESEMHLIAGRPANTVDVRIEAGQNLPD